ncbi:MAG: heat-shock protein [Oleiphilus sp.]|nr:MAG: heat-shock protein [Oleiphilus sp.]
MNSIDLTPLYRSSIGFDRLANVINSTLAADPVAPSYPPYNIEAFEENEYAITLAVAGFDLSELDISVEKGVLTVRGEKSDTSERRYLHHGIANRTFERKFNLADYVEITGASLDKGLLTIRLVKEVPEAMKPRTIEISSGSSVIEHQAEATNDQTDKEEKGEKVA